MKTPSFSPQIRRLNRDDPKRLNTLEETENCIARLMKKFSISGWESDVIVEVPPLVREFYEKYRVSKSEEFHANVIIDWTNYSIRRLTVLSALKSVDLSEALIHAANQRRFAVCALAQRSLLEHAALLNNFWHELAHYLSPEELQVEALDKLRNTVIKFAYGGRYDWIKATSGREREALTERKWRRSRAHWLPRLTEMLKGLDKYALAVGLSNTEGALLMRYAELSEFAHPTYASTVLYADLDELETFRLRQNDPKHLAYLFDLTVVRAGPILLLIERLLESLSRCRFHMFSSKT